MMTLDLLLKHASPSYETSYAKGIPMKYHEQVKKDLKHCNAIMCFMNRTFGGNSFRYIFRGKSKPGFKRPQSWCPKSHADTFAIYKRSEPWYSA